jgi:hypothetical protein
MTDDARLDEALRALPRAEASAGFTDAVLARRRPRRWPLVLAFITAGAGAVATAVALWPRPSVARELEDLRREQRALADEVAQLREAAPVIYLGRTRGVDLVLDLDRLPRTSETKGKTP